MKLFNIARAFGAAFALVLLGFAAHAVLPQPDQGLRLTDWYSIQQAITLDNQMGFATIVPGPANTQSTCTPITVPMNNITTSVASGSVCLPQATAGREVYIGNGSSQTVNVFGSNTPFVSGTQDTINTTAGSTAYTSVTTHLNANCFAPANGVWFCTAGS